MKGHPLHPLKQITVKSVAVSVQSTTVLRNAMDIPSKCMDVQKVPVFIQYQIQPTMKVGVMVW